MTNKQYVQFLEDFLKTKKTAFSFLNEIYTTIKKSQSIFNEFKDLENISTQWKREQDAIEECFDAVSGLHAELDILLASQDRDTMSPFKLKKDILTLNQCERKLNELTKKFKSKNNNIQCLIQARNSWFSKENSPDLIFESAGVLDNLRQYPDITCMPW